MGGIPGVGGRLIVSRYGKTVMYLGVWRGVAWRAESDVSITCVWRQGVSRPWDIERGSQAGGGVL